MSEVELPLPSEEAQKRLQELGATIMFEKVLTTSDTSGNGRVVIPKTVAETSFPKIEEQINPLTINVEDVFGKKFSLRYRFWVNNASRMYLVEATQELLVHYKLVVGDVLVFARLPNADIIVCGRKGTKDDVKKRPKKVNPVAKTKGGGTKKARSSAAAPSGGTKTTRGSTRTSPTGGVEDSGAVSVDDREIIKELGEGTSAEEDPNTSKSAGKGAAAAAKSKKSRQQKPPSKKEREGVNSMYEYWNGLSIPPRKDGVFRAVPATAEIVPNKVTAQHGHWTAVVNLGGELYQAFFDSRDAAVAAYNAAVQR